LAALLCADSLWGESIGDARLGTGVEGCRPPRRRNHGGTLRNYETGERAQSDLNRSRCGDGYGLSRGLMAERALMGSITETFSSLSEVLLSDYSARKAPERDILSTRLLKTCFPPRYAWDGTDYRSQGPPLGPFDIVGCWEVFPPLGEGMARSFLQMAWRLPSSAELE